MKRVLLLLFFSQFILASTFGQEQNPQRGIPYQAIARDASGVILADLELQISLVFTDQVGGATYYMETHLAKTDENGFFELLIGDGISRTGYLADVPWNEGKIWLEMTINSADKPELAVKQATQLFSVPYALFAESARQLTEAEAVELRNHSIYWTSSGNVGTRPPFHFLGNRDTEDLVVKTNGQTRATFTADGQLKVWAGSTVRGSDAVSSSYPVYIKNGNQGIFITINGSRSSANNFVTFADPEDIHGRIEGQTYPELLANPFYIIKAAVYAIDGVNLVASGVSNGIKAVAFGTAATAAYASLFLAWAGPGLTAASVANGIKLGVDVTGAAALLLNSIAWATSEANNIGVAFNSGAADYAEYLPRVPFSADLYYGDIVGVRAGQVSKVTHSADHLMVVSQNPGFLGNVPADGNTQNMEKIAFLGQVKVKVAGAVSAGDYILPSGNNDGVGIAVHPQNMRTEDYGRIVGVAWESAEEAPLNMVNCSIGMTQNEMAPKVEEISNKVDNIIGYLRGEEPLRPEMVKAERAETNGSIYELNPSSAGMKKIFSDQEFDEIVDENAAFVKALYGKAEAKLREAEDIDPASIPGMEAFFANPIKGLKEMRRDPQYEGLWGQFDHYLADKFKLKTSNN
ncbi:MAG TPA: hypothetical protein VJ953_18645 [Saprospiraceae bacterium]|nr:hypothetical protein [Saprospiraceae bacterium]